VIVGRGWTDNGLRIRRLRDVTAFGENCNSQTGDPKNRVMVVKIPGKLKTGLRGALFAFEGFGGYIDSPFEEQRRDRHG